MNFLAPAAFALAALIPIIIVMYLLKLRRTERTVSSVYLWQRMVRDIEANAPWQKLRRNLLLILQLAFLVILILTLARPFTWAEGVSGQMAILILDTSASMSAIDVSPSRLEAAKAQARQLVDRMADDVRVTVIAAGEGARVLVSASRDRRQARLAIDGVQAGTGGSDLSAALELASAIAARQPDTEIVVFSDGRVTLPERSVIQGRVRYMQMGIEGRNQAIGILSLRAMPGGGLSAFAQVANYDDAPASRRLALYADGQLVSATDVEVPPRGQQSVIADDLPAGLSVLEARLLDAEEPSGDVLPLDDRAWAVHRGGQAARVTLVSEGNLFLETALSLFPGLEVTSVRPEDYEAGVGGETGAPALTVFDAYVPVTATLPAGSLWFIAPPRSTPYFTVTGAVQQPTARAVTDARSGTGLDPLLTNVSLAEVHVLEAVRMPLPIWARTVIAGDLPAGDSGPLLYAGQVDGQRVAVLAFDLRRSDLPLQVAFPLLVANLTSWLAPDGGSDLPSKVSPGAPVSWSVPPEIASVRVTRPDGSIVELEPEGGRGLVRRQSIRRARVRRATHREPARRGERGRRRGRDAACAARVVAPAGAAGARPAHRRVAGLPARGAGAPAGNLPPMACLPRTAIVLTATTAGR